jgi:hypothetical protein
MKLFIVPALLSCTLLVGCSKDPGEGGKAEIRGRVIEQRYNSIGQPSDDPYPIAEQNVYIIYGDGSDGQFPDDNVDTGPDGSFRFKWLRKGTYTLYTISECDDCDSEEKAIYRTAEITDKKDVVNVGDMLIENH